MILLAARYVHKDRVFDEHDVLRDFHGRFAHKPGGGGTDRLDIDLEDVIDQTGGEDFDRAAATEWLSQIYAGTFAGLTVKVDGVKFKDSQTAISLQIFDADGKMVGHSSRVLSINTTDNEDLDDPESDGLGRIARHDILKLLDPSFRGDGFATQWNDHLEQWYRRAKIERVHLTANIDVGGYAWARAGYDWRDAGQSEGIIDRLRDTFIPGAEAVLRLADEGHTDWDENEALQVFSRHPDGIAFILADQAKLRAFADDLGPAVEAAYAIIDAANEHGFGSTEYPTPFDFAMLGHKRGQTGRDAVWLGKLLMLGSTWEGVRWLS